MNAGLLTPAELEQRLRQSLCQAQLMWVFNLDLPRVECTESERERLVNLWVARMDYIHGGHEGERGCAAAPANVGVF